jgi:hypothetical protein
VIQQSEFLRRNADRSNKILLFLLAALTIHRGVAKSIIRSSVSIGRIAGFDEQLAPRQNAKAP